MAKERSSWVIRFFCACAALLVVATSAAELGAQSPTWQQRVASAPPGRNNSAAAYDVYRGVTTVFGGYNGTTTAFGDTWEWNGTLWAPRITSVRPSARWGHGMAFDQKRGRVVLFGGTSGSATFQDTWEWDGFAWSQRTTPIAPSARRFAGLVYDAARGVCVLFGGFSPSAGPLNETWEYDGFTWTQRMTSTAPSPRGRMAMAWDETRRETLVFGGGTGTNVTNDLWAWNGTTWSQKSTPIAPPARWDAAFAFDGNCGRALLGGGGDATWATNFGDTWAWDGLQWTQIAGAQPPARHSPTLVHDAQRGQFVLWGGRDAAGFRNDTWELGPSCSRTMSVVAAPVVGQTAQFRYDYPGPAANLHFCWTLLTPRQPAAFAVPIPGLPTIGLCRVDLFNQLLDPAVFLDGSGSLVTSVAIPANPALNGFDFDVQSVDLDFFTLALRWASNDIEITTAGLTVPVASFTATPTSGSAPLTVQFTDTSTQFPTAWQWDFDNDGTIDSTQQNPSWTYASNGVYSVRLMATNMVGTASGTSLNVVQVGSVLPNPALNMAPVAPGAFSMGSSIGLSNEQPVRMVTLAHPFWIGRFEVTQDEYSALLGSNPSVFQGALAPNSGGRPVDSVTWNDANAYCAALTVRERAAGRVPPGYEYRLPTEAEWEYCCRAGTSSEWSTGQSLDSSQANFFGALANGALIDGQTAVVGSYAPNPYGLYDMHGNVMEWCLDDFLPYPPGPATDPLSGYGGAPICRGGSWSVAHPAFVCRSAYRTHSGPIGRSSIFGFRVVLAPALPVALNAALNMVAIPLGSFQMGSNNGALAEQPVHQVDFLVPFWMSRFEVTQENYLSIMGTNPSFFQGIASPGAPQRPVEQVDWTAAVNYCQALTLMERAARRVPPGYEYRLPTEAEWEYCCRAGTTTEWSAGTSLNTSQANFQGGLANALYIYGQTAVVGSYAPNAFGLNDMHGNVKEWCLDSFAGYSSLPQTAPFVTGGTYRLFRGGGFDSSGFATRSAFRDSQPGGTYYNLGLRIVLAPSLTP